MKKTSCISNWSFRSQIVALTATIFGIAVASASSGASLLTNGNFSSLDGWEQDGEKPEIVLDERNSPFSSVHANNGRSVMIQGETTRGKNAIEQTFDLRGARKFQFSFDFQVLESDSPEVLSGWLVALVDAVDQSEYLVAVDFSTRAMVSVGQRNRALHIPDRDFSPGVWYHFESTIDLDARTCSGVIESESGESVSFFEIPLGDAIDFQPVAVVVRKLGGLPGIPFLLDNIDISKAE